MPARRSRNIDHDRPETYPVYQLAIHVDVQGDASSAVVGLKPTGLDVHFSDGMVTHFDLEGRLLRLADPPVQWRRGLSGRTIQLRRCGRHEGGGWQRRLLSNREAEEVLCEVNARQRAVHVAFCNDRYRVEKAPEGQTEFEAIARDALEAAARFDVAAARADVARFQSLYDDVPILPPDQYSSLVLAATAGCRYNQCTFCGFYRDVRYRAKTPSEFQQHLEDAVAYHGRGLANRRSIFLGQANSLLGSRSWREEMLRIVNQSVELPPAAETSVTPAWWRGSSRRFNGITSFLDAFVGVRMSASEFAALRQLNLRQIFLGLETGDAALLKWLKKPATPDQMLETVQAARDGGVRVGVIALVGAGGERFFDAHVRETVALIRAMALRPGDYVYLSPLVPTTGTEYAALAAAAGTRPLSPSRLAVQEQLIRDGLATSPSRQGPYVAHYEVEQFVY